MTNKPRKGIKIFQRKSARRNLLTFLNGNGKIVLYLLERASTKLLETLRLVAKLTQASLDLKRTAKVLVTQWQC